MKFVAMSVFLFLALISGGQVDGQSRYLPADSILRVTAPDLWPKPLVGKWHHTNADSVFILFGSDLRPAAIPLASVKRVERRTLRESSFFPIPFAVAGVILGGVAAIEITGNAHKDAGAGGFLAFWTGALVLGYAGWKLAKPLQRPGWEQIPVASLRNDFDEP